MLNNTGYPTRNRPTKQCYESKKCTNLKKNSPKFTQAPFDPCTTSASRGVPRDPWCRCTLPNHRLTLLLIERRPKTEQLSSDQAGQTAETAKHQITRAGQLHNQCSHYRHTANPFPPSSSHSQIATAENRPQRLSSHSAE